ncbi:DUF2214 domain-containing protein [Pigmentiphaga aceris]|uniref:DUF2214 domain-containing protein n=1 Tax=Pigmentiphaga aceris TaxID=1940612 RepID=A0A5C0AW45_9BURK|nr:DUF6644 family protein [Pigmentiphaga aceris]QEI06528.1 DUF2214 domain-containing protein [Pigmentiphaga aceris]
MDIIWTWLGQLPHALLLQRSSTSYLLVNAAHIAALGVLLGSIMSLDLRLLGGFRQVPLAVIGPFLSRMAAWGLGLAVLTGFLLFSVRPAEYADNLAFLCKVGLVALAVLNAWAVHAGPRWREALAAGKASSGLRVQALCSIVLWLAAVVAGRWIGFL